ncbi:MAG: stage 0 sporulation family protein [Spirochaetaceae bacterium]|nr:stage 0 sporulation family protein [Spirochaetaceae bacterium]
MDTPEDDGNKSERGSSAAYRGVPLYQLKLEYSREIFFAPVNENPPLAAGTSVVIPTRFGDDIALVLGVAKNPTGVSKNTFVSIVRVAAEGDLKKRKALEEREGGAYTIFHEKVDKHHLSMKLLCTHFLFDESKILFFFSAETRIDFRELVKDLVAVFKVRIELRQIGARDEARLSGGLGMCGRPICCNAISDKLRSVSIRMAKDQNLSLNSMKISGQCGRLLCCLSYENEWYAEARKNLPQEGVVIHYDDAVFHVSAVNPIARIVQISGDDGRVLEIPVGRFLQRHNHWEIGA